MTIDGHRSPKTVIGGNHGIEILKRVRKLKRAQWLRALAEFKLCTIVYMWFVKNHLEQIILFLCKLIKMFLESELGVN